MAKACRSAKTLARKPAEIGQLLLDHLGERVLARVVERALGVAAPKAAGRRSAGQHRVLTGSEQLLEQRRGPQRVKLGLLDTRSVQPEQVLLRAKGFRARAQVGL